MTNFLGRTRTQQRMSKVFYTFSMSVLIYFLFSTIRQNLVQEKGTDHESTSSYFRINIRVLMPRTNPHSLERQISVPEYNSAAENTEEGQVLGRLRSRAGFTLPPGTPI